MRSGVFIFPPAPLFKELNYVFFLAHIAGSTKMFAQIKRSLPPRGRCRTNVRRKEYACIINFNIFMPKNSFRHCFAMPPSSRGRLGYTLHLCRGDLRSPAGERSSPLPDDTKNVSVSQKNGGSKPPPYREINNFVLSITIWRNSIKKPSPSPTGEGS